MRPSFGSLCKPKAVVVDGGDASSNIGLGVDLAFFCACAVVADGRFYDLIVFIGFAVAD